MKGGRGVGRITVRGYPPFDLDPRRAADSTTERLFGAPIEQGPLHHPWRTNVGAGPARESRAGPAPTGGLGGGRIVGASLLANRLRCGVHSRASSLLRKAVLACNVAIRPPGRCQALSRIRCIAPIPGMSANFPIQLLPQSPGRTAYARRPMQRPEPRR
ncbi:hypothetical protein PCLA_05r0104 [Pseudomonas citronellolis]|nr:hypothetical protein PCLA_05r0104 [Pseudomonas citronellolis]